MDTLALAMQPHLKLFFRVFSLLSATMVIVACKDDRPDYEKLAGIRPSTPVHFVLPDNFRGEIQITEDKAKGVTSHNSSNRIEICVPSTGRIVLKDWSPLFREHREFASFISGNPIPDPNMTPSGQLFARNIVAFWNLGTVMSSTITQERLIYFVGTKEELEQLK